MMTSSDPWQQLAAYCPPEILNAPKTWGDPLRPATREMPNYLDAMVQYIVKNVVGHPWQNVLILTAAVLSSEKVSWGTVFQKLNTLHCRFREIFSGLDLHTFAEWDADKHIRMYLTGLIPSDSTPTTKLAYWYAYRATHDYLQRWLRSLPQDLQSAYHPYLLPPVRDREEFGRLVRQGEVRADQEDRRKEQTDALMPLYVELRAQAHFRYNLLKHMRQAYYEAITAVESGQQTLPLTFEFTGGTSPIPKNRPTESLRFRLWDRRTFVLAHLGQYSARYGRMCRQHLESFSPAKNTYVLEFLGARGTNESSPTGGLWFIELLQHDVLGTLTQSGALEDIATKQEWLRQQGYGGFWRTEAAGEDTASERPMTSPFHGDTPGIMLPTRESGTDQFIRHALLKTGVVFVPIENFFIAATFAMVALHIMTANGMRINELLQIRTNKDCIDSIVLPLAPGQHDQPREIHWVVRVIPKGHLTPKQYYFDDEHLRLLSLIKAMLCAQYHIPIDPETGGNLPVVSFRSTNQQKHRFAPDRYLFQFAGRGLTQNDVRASIRFLVHGLTIETLDGRRVIITPHLLRHGFANWAANVMEEPIDVIGAILQQRDLRVTQYYSRPTARRIADRSANLMGQISSYIDIEDLIIRGPEEIQRQLQEAQATHGTLAHVRGGRCLVAGECPFFFSCTGCFAKAPDPAFRDEVLESRTFAVKFMTRAQTRGLTLEAIQWQKKVQQHDTEMHEMDLIEQYRANEASEPEVCFVDDN